MHKIWQHVSTSVRPVEQYTWRMKHVCKFKSNIFASCVDGILLLLSDYTCPCYRSIVRLYHRSRCWSEGKISVSIWNQTPILLSSIH
jgi:hypothetical protein